MIFVDTWAWVALADRRDPYHHSATPVHQQMTAAGRKYVINDYVLSETITYLFDALTYDQAKAFVEAILQSADDGTYELIHVSPSQFNRAWRMRVKYQDKPDISFVDFTSMVVMQDLGITEIFTGDKHFLQVNRGFQLVP